MTDQTKEKRTEFLTARQLAEVLQVSESTVHRLRRSGRIPAITLTERLIRFNLKDVKAALGVGRPVGKTASEPAPEEAPSGQLAFEHLFTGVMERE